jgi:hypothetical protein
MELCVVCEGQKFLGKLSDEQTSKILKMGCERPSERKGIIKGVVKGAFHARRYGSSFLSFSFAAVLSYRNHINVSVAIFFLLQRYLC